MFKFCEETRQSAQEHHATGFYYAVARDMVLRVAGGEVSHAFLYKNDISMREYIFDNNTWMSQVPYDAEPDSLHCQAKC